MGIQALAQSVTRLEEVARSPDAASLAIVVCVRADLAVYEHRQVGADAGPDQLQGGVFGEVGVARFVEGVSDSPVSALHWSNGWMGSSPARARWPAACRRSPGVGVRRVVYSSIASSVVERSWRVNR